MRLFRTPLLLLCLFATPLFGVLSVRAQDDPNIEIGIKPYGAYQAGNIDNVSLANGSLGVDIPLISYPQRGGKLKLAFSMHYFNGSHSDAVECVGTGCITYYTVTSSGFQLIDNGAVFETWNNGYGNQGDPTAQYTVSEADGASHLLGATGTNQLESVDGSAFKVLVGGSNVPFMSITDADGTIYDSENQSCYYGYPGLSGPGDEEFDPCELSRTDTNGNQITYSPAAGWTDSVGRTIPLPTATSDFTGCSGSEPTASAAIWDLPGVNGVSYQLKFCYFSDNSGTQLQSVVLPDGTAWTFQYETELIGYDSSTGSDQAFPVYMDNLTQVTFPTGGSLSYTWANNYAFCEDALDPTNMAVASRTLNPNDGDPVGTWTYNYNQNPSVFTTIATDPLGNDTVHKFLGFCYLYETEKQTYQGSSSGTLLQTVDTTYSYNTPTQYSDYDPDVLLNVVPSTVTTTWFNGETSEVQYGYDAGFQFQSFGMSVDTPFSSGGSATVYTGTFGKELTKKEYDYGSGAPGNLLRTTTTAWYALSHSNYLSANLLNLPASV